MYRMTFAMIKKNNNNNRLADTSYRNLKQLAPVCRAFQCQTPKFIVSQYDLWRKWIEIYA